MSSISLPIITDVIKTWEAKVQNLPVWYIEILNIQDCAIGIQEGFKYDVEVFEPNGDSEIIEGCTMTKEQVKMLYFEMGETND